MLAVSSLAAQSAGEAGRVQLRFDRAAIADGEWWRLATGHIAHLGGAHTVMNVIALWLVWLLVGRGFAPRVWVAVTVASIAGIDLGLWVLDPSLSWYVGLSGLLHGLFAAGLVARAGEARTEAAVLGGLLVAKLAFEQLVGPLPGSEASAGGAVVVNAHLYGAAAGALAAAAMRVGVRRRVPI